MDQNQLKNVEKQLKDAEESFQCTFNEYNEAKCAITVLDHEESTWRQLLFEKQFTHTENQNQLSTNRELLLKSIESFSNKIEESFQNSILDNFIEQLDATNQHIKLHSEIENFTDIQKLNSEIERQINELKEKLIKIDAKINLYESRNNNYGHQETMNDDDNDDEVLIKRLQDATKSVLINVSKTDDQIKILTDMIFKKKNSIHTIPSARHISSNLDVNARNVSRNDFFDNESNDYVTDNKLYDNNYLFEMDVPETNFTVNLSVNEELHNMSNSFDYDSTVINVDEIMDSADYLYTSTGIDNQIQNVLNNNNIPQEECYNSNDDDHYDIAEINNFNHDYSVTLGE